MKTGWEDKVIAIIKSESFLDHGTAQMSKQRQCMHSKQHAPLTVQPSMQILQPNLAAFNNSMLTIPHKMHKQHITLLTSAVLFHKSQHSNVQTNFYCRKYVMFTAAAAAVTIVDFCPTRLLLWSFSSLGWTLKAGMLTRLLSTRPRQSIQGQEHKYIPKARPSPQYSKPRPRPSSMHCLLVIIQ